MNIKKTVRILHLWLGLLSGTIVFILGLTGCIYAFINEIVPIIYHEKLFVDEIGDSRIPLDQLILTAQNQWGQERPLTTMEVFPDPRRSIHFRSFQESDQSGWWYWDEKEFYESLYLDPYSGKVIQKENSQFEFFRIILYLHWSLLLHTEIGKPIVGTATLLFVLSLISGIILWWPKNKMARKSRYWFRWKKGTGWKRKTYDLHNIPGFYAMVLALTMALTGMFWALDWFGKSALWLANMGKEYEMPAPVYSDAEPGKNQKGISPVIDQVSEQFPSAQSYLVYFPKNDSSAINVGILVEKSYQSVLQQYDQYKGTLLSTYSFQDKNPGEKLEALNYDIHVGSIGGIYGKILAFLISLISASLPVTGLLIWYNRNWGKKKRD